MSSILFSKCYIITLQLQKFSYNFYLIFLIMLGGF